MARTVSDTILRFATADDAGLLLQLIRELAAYERAPDAVVATEDDLRKHGFGPERRFEALLASRELHQVSHERAVEPQLVIREHQPAGDARRV